MKLSCSQHSLEMGESLYGTAPHYQGYLLIEVPPPWPAKIYQHPLLPKNFKAWVKEKDLCPLFIAHSQTAKTGPFQIFLYTSNQKGGNQGVFKEARDFQKAIEEDNLSSLFTHHKADSLLLVCTHGSRDSCCGSFGIPFYLRLEKEVESQKLSFRVFRSSHMGGHRFAVNLLQLPEGKMYGRLSEKEIPFFLETLQNKKIPFTHLRGTTYKSGLSQMAEIWALQQGFLPSQILNFQEEKGAVLLTIEEKEERHKYRVNLRKGEKPISVLGSCKDIEPKEVYPWEIEKVERI